MSEFYTCPKCFAARENNSSCLNEICVDYVPHKTNTPTPSDEAKFKCPDCGSPLRDSLTVKPQVTVNVGANPTPASNPSDEAKARELIQRIESSLLKSDLSWHGHIVELTSLFAAERERDEFEVKLGEAQQWIDSEPDWKDKYMKMYSDLQAERDSFREKAEALDWLDKRQLHIYTDEYPARLFDVYRPTNHQRLLSAIQQAKENK